MKVKSLSLTVFLVGIPRVVTFEDGTVDSVAVASKLQKALWDERVPYASCLNGHYYSHEINEILEDFVPLLLNKALNGIRMNFLDISLFMVGLEPLVIHTRREKQQQDF